MSEATAKLGREHIKFNGRTDVEAIDKRKAELAQYAQTLETPSVELLASACFPVVLVSVYGSN